jgi:hypothetical protein
MRYGAKMMERGNHGTGRLSDQELLAKLLHAEFLKPYQDINAFPS